MANEYDIEEGIGYIGSLWQGQYNTPSLVGNVYQIINGPNTISSPLVESIYVTSDKDLDITTLNKQLPDSTYFKLGKLSESQVKDLESAVKLDPEWTRNQTVLFKYDPRSGERPGSSNIPLQDNWAFDVSDDPKMLYNVPESIVWAPFVFVIKDDYFKAVLDYFKAIESPQYTWQKDVVANPNKVIPQEDTTQIPRQPNPPINTTPIFDPPPVDLDLFAEEQALVEFEQIRNQYTVSSLEEFNSKLKQVEQEMSDMMRAFQETQGNLPFSEDVVLATRIKLLMMLRNYLFAQLSELENVGSPLKEPERYDVDDNGDIVILDRATQTEPTIQTVAVDDLDEFDEFIDEIIDDLTIDENGTYVFKRISRITDYATPISRIKTRGLFTCAGERMNAFFTASLSAKNQSYYTSVYNAEPGTFNAFHQFDVSYCHVSGSGSSYIETGSDLYPAKAMYSKYLLETVGSGSGKFPFKNGVNGDYFYVIQFDRDTYNDGIDVGNFELRLAPLSGSTGNISLDPSSSITYSLIDDSGDAKQRLSLRGELNEFYYLVSGSVRDGIYSNEDDDAWGVVYPRLGVIILDGVVLDNSCSFATGLSSSDGENPNRLFYSISGSSTFTAGRTVTSSFFARSIDRSLTETYFCRVEPEEFNHSSNYTYRIESGSFKYEYFKNDPHSYITSVGLYNNRKELVAVGKLKNPIRKNSNKNYIFEIKVRLN